MERYQKKPAKTELNKIQSLLIPKMSWFQYKIIHHNKNQESNGMEKKKNLIDANDEIRGRITQ